MSPPTRTPRHRQLLLLWLAPLLAFGVAAPGLKAASLDLTVHDFGLGIGDSEVIHGLRLNFRDHDLRRVNGINLTVWEPHRRAPGQVRGLALGVPVTGAATIQGLGLGVGIGARRNADGVLVGLLGVGTGDRLRGLGIAGLGAGTGGDLEGFLIAGLGAGLGGDGRGGLIGGLGVGAGGDLQGLSIAGFGVGAGEDLGGISLAGLAVGAGGNVQGVQIAGLAVGAGETMRGVQIAGLAVGAGESLQGLSVAGLAAGAPNVWGILVAGIASGGVEVSGISASLAHFRIADDGVLKGIAVSAFNRIEGAQLGLTVGLFNMASELEGIQIGLLNYAGNKRKSLRWLPLVNADF